MNNDYMHNLESEFFGVLRSLVKKSQPPKKFKESSWKKLTKIKKYQERCMTGK